MDAPAGIDHSAGPRGQSNRRVTQGHPLVGRVWTAGTRSLHVVAKFFSPPQIRRLFDYISLSSIWQASLTTGARANDEC